MPASQAKRGPNPRRGASASLRLPRGICSISSNLPLRAPCARRPPRPLLRRALQGHFLQLRVVLQILPQGLPSLLGGETPQRGRSLAALLGAAVCPCRRAIPRRPSEDGDRCQEGTRCSASWRRWCHLPYARPQAANRSISRGHTHLVVIVRPLRVQLFPTQVAASIPNRSRFFMGCHPPSPLVNPLLNGGKIKTLRPPLCVPHGHLMWLQPSVLREVGSPPQAAASRRAFGTSGTCRTTLGPLENL